MSKSTGLGVIKGSYSSPQLLWRLILIARPYWLHLVAIVILSLLATPLTLLAPLPIKIVVDHVIGSSELPAAVLRWLPRGLTDTPHSRLLLAACLVAVLAALTALQWTTNWWLRAYTGEKLILRLRAQLFRHVQQLAFTYHDREGSTDSTYRIQNDAGAIRDVLMASMLTLLTSAIPLFGLVSALLFIDWELAAIALATSPILFMTVRFFSARLRNRWHTVKEGESMAMSVVQEALSSLRVVKAYCREEYELERFEAKSLQRIRQQLRTIGLHCTFEFLVEITVGIGTALVLFVGVSHVLQGVISLGELLMVMAYIAQIFGPLQTMSQSSAGLSNGLASVERVFAVMDRGPEIVESPQARSLHRARGEVVFEDVSFGYDAGGLVLKHISLNVPAGTCIGIQGRTGSGKSTLISLLMRFYDPSSGRILLDGVDIRDYHVKDLRQQIALVLQEPVLFATSIRENIEYGRLGASQQDIEKAAKLANAHDFISAMPEGYDSDVGERGATLSGGERQRIALARAFLKDAPILILDEPTSSVDLKTETLIMNAIDRLMEGRTTFMIAHRLSTLDRCDLRLELAAGELNELYPTKQRELMRQGGREIT
jgi:ATP-binding cassette subfamily B protein